MKKCIIYYSNNAIDGSPVNNMCVKFLKESGLDIISVTHRPFDLGTNLILEGPGLARTILLQLLHGLNYAIAEGYEVAYCGEHDCLYPRHHFQLEETGLAYNFNQWRSCPDAYHGRPAHRLVLSSMFGGPEVLKAGILKKLNEPAPLIHIEPERISGKYTLVRSKYPIIDIRHGRNYTQWKPKGRSKLNLKYWGDNVKLRKRLGLETKEMV